MPLRDCRGSVLPISPNGQLRIMMVQLHDEKEVQLSHGSQQDDGGASRPMFGEPSVLFQDVLDMLDVFVRRIWKWILSSTAKP